MDRLSKLDCDELIRQMRADCERLIRQVGEAVNSARDGHLINDSEEQVRDLMQEFREKTYQTATQMRIEATEKSVAFSPGEGPPACPGGGQPVGSELQRLGEVASSSLRKARRNHRSGGG
jgi:hypothetical protein